jgi:hypothetical protein
MPVTFYEELGVPGSASEEEIRRAYKRLARLFHPDHQSDPELRLFAELQMRRLNEIAAVLTDPMRRMLYNATLDHAGRDMEVLLPEQGANWRELLHFDRKAAVWLATGAVSAGLLLLLFWSRSTPESEPLTAAASVTPAPTPTPEPTAGTPGPAPAVDTVPQTPAEPTLLGLPPPALPAVALPKTNVLLKYRRVLALNPSLAHVPPPPPAIQPVSPPNAASIQPLPAAVFSVIQPMPRPHPGLSGRWLFTAREPAQQSAGKYAARDVEVGISEQSGNLYGYYEATYDVPANSILPHVSFRFSAPAAGDTAVGNWSTPDGNRGEIRLKMKGDNSLEVVWLTTRIRTHGRLASGKVELTRFP